ncbi:hypothetical protein GCM10025864_35300 [Luteimicrobium album]|uniref:DUF3071 domain-containing protein n=1 Tax=Luteimicrobium album TaxID=1054550 RepID=A0ABQ6I659_9MICO|nr:septation protein SepH [Luteimicrobium album]GMA25771.1 hypothetical protein GCM10025864_35300 [Luteimicrobium album]
MNELNLVGLHEDGESLVLAGPMGERYTVRIDDTLRAAVRRDRPQLEQLRASSPGTLPVREIQARIRAGASAEQVAAEAGVPVEHVRRYEGPVLAEREHVVDRVRATRLGDADAPTLADLVADRLASRDVDAESVAWDAARDASGTWRATARFAAGGRDRTATWAYDASSREVRALDDEARWLSENEVGAPTASRTTTSGPRCDPCCPRSTGCWSVGGTRATPGTPRRRTRSWTTSVGAGARAPPTSSRRTSRGSVPCVTSRTPPVPGRTVPAVRARRTVTRPATWSPRTTPTTSPATTRTTTAAAGAGSASGTGTTACPSPTG